MQIGLCHKCADRITAPGQTLGTATSQILIGCKIEKHPENGKNCPLTKKSQA